MLFNSLPVFLFFSAFFAVFFLVCGGRNQKLWAITLGSLLYYSSFDRHFVLLLPAIALFDFYVGRAIAGAEVNDRGRKRLIWASVALNLSVLAMFKYFNFFLDVSLSLMHHLGITSRPGPLMKILIPVGVSFFTFQRLRYTIDVYRGELKARERCPGQGSPKFSRLLADRLFERLSAASPRTDEVTAP